MRTIRKRMAVAEPGLRCNRLGSAARRAVASTGAACDEAGALTVVKRGVAA